MEEQFITKYRPYFLNDFYFEPSVRTMIDLLLEIDDLNVLFIGNSNSGKTSLLYALIREYYGLSKTSKLPENNILFINTLKEQGINYFRNEMKTFCQSQSSIHRRKKMVIIDDMDIINQQNQQVFCNYIDKYKDNVCFVSVCSNIQKIIENIQSRTHILKIQPPTPTQLMTFMERILMKEKMILEPSAKEYLLLISNNSIRALMNHLEKIHIYIGKNDSIVSLELCKMLCVNISFSKFEEYLTLLKQKELIKAIAILYSIHDYGYSVIDILDYLFSFVKITESLDENEKYKITHILCKYITIFHKVHEDIIELALFTNNLTEILYTDMKENDTKTNYTF
jgi:DNA polymerase III delta prime subunit